MKLMYSPCCNSLVVPHPHPSIKKECSCGQTTVWWDDPHTGHLAIHDPQHKASVVGIHNGILKQPYSNKELFRDILDKTPDNYLFKDVDSLIIHVLPGTTQDTRYA